MRLLEKLSVVARQRGMASSTIECYSMWVKQFVKFAAAHRGEWVHPDHLGTGDVEAFLNDLVVGRELAGATQNQALNALVFLYKHVLDTLPQEHLGKFLLQRSKRPKRVPTVLSGAEVRRASKPFDQTHASDPVRVDRCEPASKDHANRTECRPKPDRTLPSVAFLLNSVVVEKHPCRRRPCLTLSITTRVMARSLELASWP